MDASHYAAGAGAFGIAHLPATPYRKHTERCSDQAGQRLTGDGQVHRIEAKQQRGDRPQHLDDAEAEIPPQVEDHRKVL